MTPTLCKTKHLRIRGGSGSTPPGCSRWFPSSLCTVHALMPCNANKCCLMLLSSGQRLWLNCGMQRFGVSVCAHAWRREVYTQCLPWSFSTVYFGTVSFTRTGTHQLLDQLQQALGVFLPRCLQCWGTCVHCHTQLCTRVNGDPNSFSHWRNQRLTNYAISLMISPPSVLSP